MTPLDILARKILLKEQALSLLQEEIENLEVEITTLKNTDPAPLETPCR